MKNGIANKSLAFAIRIVNLYKHLTKNKIEYVMSKQLLRSGTGFGALIIEAEHAQSKVDFLNKMNVTLKEANESKYWLILMKKTVYLSKEAYDSIEEEILIFIRFLASIVKTIKINLGRNLPQYQLSIFI